MVFKHNGFSWSLMTLKANRKKEIGTFSSQAKDRVTASVATTDLGNRNIAALLANALDLQQASVEVRSEP